MQCILDLIDLIKGHKICYVEIGVCIWEELEEDDEHDQNTGKYYQRISIFLK